MSHNLSWCRGFLCRGFLAACVAVATLVEGASGSVIVPVSGTSAVGHAVSFVATMTIAGDALVIRLDNTSSRATTDAADVLTSFYFDIVGGSGRPTLTHTAASGFVHLVRSGTTDLPYVYTPQTFTQASGTASNLRATANGDNSWLFRTMNPASSPNLGFGIGTVGNSGFNPNGFTPQIVGQGSTMINFGIFSGGDIDPAGVLNNRYLVKNTATFTFSGLSGYTEANIVDRYAFGLGTNPDSTFIISLPEPGSATLVATAVATLVAAGCRRRPFRRKPFMTWVWPTSGA